MVCLVAFFTDFPGHFLNADFQTELWDHYVSMKGLSQLVGLSSNDRVDKLSHMIERRLLGKKTYADLLARQQRPLIVIHATDLNRGADFQFTQDQFDPLCADLSTVPVARAVAASSAVPILFGPVAIKNNSGRCGYIRPRWIEQPGSEPQDHTRTQRAVRRAADFDSYLDSSAATGRPWIHLTDGGISDNWACADRSNPAWRAAAGSPLKRLGVNGVRKVVFVVASAEVLPDSGIDQSGLPPSTTQMASAVVDALMNNNSFETLTWLRASFRYWREQALEMSQSSENSP